MKKFGMCCMVLLLCTSLACCGTAQQTEVAEPSEEVAVEPVPVAKQLETEEPVESIQYGVEYDSGNGYSVTISGFSIQNGEFHPSNSSWVSILLDDYEYYFVVTAECVNASDECLYLSSGNENPFEMTLTSCDKYQNEYFGWLITETADHCSFEFDGVFDGVYLQPGEGRRVHYICEILPSLPAGDLTLTINGEEYFVYHYEMNGTPEPVEMIVTEPLTVENVGTVTWNGVDLDTQLLPPDAAGEYVYYEAREGSIYAIASLTVENNGTEAAVLEDMLDAALTLDNITYHAALLAVEDGAFTDSMTIEHGASAELYAVAEIPKDFAAETVTLNLEFGGSVYTAAVTF